MASTGWFRTIRHEQSEKTIASALKLKLQKSRMQIKRKQEDKMYGRSDSKLGEEGVSGVEGEGTTSSMKGSIEQRWTPGLVKLVAGQEAEEEFPEAGEQLEGGGPGSGPGSAGGSRPGTAGGEKQVRVEEKSEEVRVVGGAEK